MRDFTHLSKSTLDLGLLRRNPVQARSLQKVNAILAAAEEILITKGYGAAASDPDGLISAARVTAGSFYTYFPNCEVVMEVLRHQYLSEAVNVTEDVASGSYCTWQDGVRALNEAYVNFYRRPAIRELLLNSPLSPSVKTREREVDFYIATRLTEILRDLDGRFASVPRQKIDVAEEIAVALLRYAFREDPAGSPTIVAEIDTAMIAYLAACL